MTKLIQLMVTACFAAALAAPAFAMDDMKPMKHPAKTMKKEAPKSSTDMLNGQSLQAAQSGQNFMPAPAK